MADRLLQGKRILVVGINYAPEHTGIAPYTTQACEYLAQQGATVTVMAGVPHYPHWTVPPAYRRRLVVDEQHGDVAVRRLRHTVPVRQTALTRSLYELTFGAHVLARAPQNVPDAIIAIVPSLAGAVAAARLAERWNSPFVVWVQDLMAPAAQQTGIKGGARLAVVTRLLERYVLRRAGAVLVLNAAFQQYVENLGVDHRRVHVLPNWTHVSAPLDRRLEIRERLGWGAHDVVALHSGNMGLKQGLDNIVEAARLAAWQSPDVKFVLMGDGSQRVALMKRGAGVSNLSFLPPAPTDEFPDVLAAADVLVVNERATTVDMSLPSKLTSYFRAARPVVAAVPSNGGTAREVLRSGAGRVVTPEQPQLLLAEVLSITANPEHIARFRNAAVDYCEHELDATAALGHLARLVHSTQAVSGEQ